MSTMKRPEMEVVRFKEADIIVASGNIARLSGFGNGGTDNGSVSFGGKNYFYQDRESLYQNLHNGSSTTFDNYNNIAEIANLFEFEHYNDELTNEWDGTYHWNGSKFIKQ